MKLTYFFLEGGFVFIKLFDLRPPVCFVFIFGILGLLQDTFLVFKIMKLYFESKFPLLEGISYETF